MQKKTIFSIFSLLLVFALAGCQSMAGSILQLAAAQTSAMQNKLAAGTLMLEGTSQAVTDEQAAELLPLWKAVKSLSKSNVASSAEIQALYDQITETMTTDQVQAIKNMSLTQDDMASLMSKYGAQRVQSNSSTSSSAGRGTSSSGQAGGPGGNMGGGMPPDGGGIPGGAELGGAQMGGTTAGQPSTQTTPSSAQTVKTSTQANANLMFVDSLITLLQQRVNA